MGNGRQANGDRWVGFSDCDKHICTEGGDCLVCEIERLTTEVTVQRNLFDGELRHSEELRNNIKQLTAEDQRKDAVVKAAKLLAPMLRVDYDVFIPTSKTAAIINLKAAVAQLDTASGTQERPFRTEAARRR